MIFFVSLSQVMAHSMPQSILDDVAMVSNVAGKISPLTPFPVFMFILTVDAVVTNILYISQIYLRYISIFIKRVLTF